MKSSLKFCVVAAGEFDLYVAEPRACEWDIAAGHAILKHAGGDVTDFDGNEILYGKKNFKNGKLTQKIDFLGASFSVSAGGAFVNSLSKYLQLTIVGSRFLYSFE